MAAAVLALRLVLIAAGHPLERGVDTDLARIALLSTIVLRLAKHIWLVRATEEDLRQQVENTCRGLFLECREPQRGRFLLTARGCTWHLRMREISHRTQFLILPRLADGGKVALLIQWLSKQYPGPLPRVRRVLKRRMQ